MKIIYDSVYQNAVNEDCTIKITKIPQNETVKVCRIRSYESSQTLVMFKGWYYSDIQQHGHPVNKVIPLENRVSEKSAIKFAEKIKKNHKKYSSIQNLEYFLIGTKLYVKYCKKLQLGITQTGNTLFGDWWSLWVEEKCNPNLTYKKFTRKNFEKSLREAKKWIKRENPNKKIHFSYPTIQWFEGSEKL